MTTDITQIATTDQFKSALIWVRNTSLTEAQLRMLKAQWANPASTITATQLAAACDYVSYSGANLQYGILASKVASAIGFQPATRKDGTPMWWSTLSYSDHAVSGDGSGDFQFIMRPELRAALEQMRWVK